MNLDQPNNYINHSPLKSFLIYRAQPKMKKEKSTTKFDSHASFYEHRLDSTHGSHSLFLQLI